MSADEEKEFITIMQYCERYDYSPRYIRKLIKTKKLEAYKSHDRGRWMVRADQRVEWVRPKDKSGRTKSEMELIRVKHWDDLAEMAKGFVSFHKRYLLDIQGDGYDGNVINDGEFEQIDAPIAESLLLHLKAEFTEFAEIKDWRELISVDLKPTAYRKLILVSNRRKFQGTCPICQSI